MIYQIKKLPPKWALFALPFPSEHRLFLGKSRLCADSNKSGVRPHLVQGNYISKGKNHNVGLIYKLYEMERLVDIFIGY